MFSPDPLVGFVAVLTAEGVGKDHANPATVEWAAFVAVTCVLQG